MRTSNLARLFGAVLGLAIASCAMAFDGTPSPRQLPLNPSDAARAGTQAFRSGNLQEAIASWTRAAESGHVTSAWRLGRLFADGDNGVERDDLQAFRWFQQIIQTHGDEHPGSPQAQIASRAFVEVGGYFLSGIPGTEVRQDFSKALRMFYHAASVFGDADAQYNIGRMYLEGAGVEFNPRVAVSWLRNAAEKGHKNAQGMLGEVLFYGRSIERRTIEGLMWLSLARQQARGVRDAWIVSSFDDAYTLASDEERTNAARAMRAWRRVGQ
jgi:TPR repeat protein